LGAEVEDAGFLQSLNDEQKAALTERSTKRRYPKGSTLLNEGDVSGRVMLLGSGRVKICSFTADGKEVMLALRGPGELLGDLSAIDGQPASATVCALEEVEVLVLSARDFKEFLGTTPGAALKLLELSVGRLRESDQKRSEFGAFDAVSRVAARLVELAERFGEESEEGLRISVPLSQEELAGWIGASRESVSKALQALRSRGLIETHRRGITVCDLEKLRKRAT
jgi:CRP-like cAMP-binding protein